MTGQIPPDKLRALAQICSEFMGVSVATQRERLRRAFEHFPSLSTVEIRQGLDIIHPAGRVQELRDEGATIHTLWTTVVSDNGANHRVANYLWVREVQHAA